MGTFYQIKPYLDSIDNIHALEASLCSSLLKIAEESIVLQNTMS